MKRIGIGIIGTGFGASVQLPGFLNLPEAHVIGIASSDGARSKELQKKYDLPQYFHSWQELIACKDIDIVSVASAPLFHEEQARAAIAAGKHVLCEKPFTMSAAAARSLLDGAKKAGITHGINFEFRELAAMQLLKKEVKNIGTVKQATFSWIVGSWADPTRPWRWQCDRAQGGGILSALGVHLFDAAWWMVGPAAKLRADLGIAVKTRPSSDGTMKEVTSEDTALIEMETSNGTTITVNLSNVDIDGKGLTIELEGETGTLMLESLSQDYGTGLRVKRDGEVLLDFATPETGIDQRIPPFEQLARRFIAAAAVHEPFEPSFEHGVYARTLYDAALESHGSWVDIG